ncbi:MAG: type IV pilus modification protein PilV [Methylococcaceae bacterium]|jgi:type IV pilus assembly protein PilV
MNQHSGFTLIEVLVTTIILAIGLLGMATLQLTTLKSNHSAYSRSQATLLAYDMADRMRANAISTANYLSSFKAASAAACKTGDDPCTACTTTAKTCTAVEVAENDLYQWNKALTTALAGGTGVISRTGAGTAISPYIYQVTLQWDDNRDGSVDASDPSFLVSFQL